LCVETITASGILSSHRQYGATEGLMSEENAAASVSPEIIPAPAAAAESAKTADTTQQTPATTEAGAVTEGAKPTEAEEAAKATEAAKALAARKQTARERINELTRKTGDAERRAERAEREAAELRARFKEPDPATFDDVSKLYVAQTRHTLNEDRAEQLKSEAERAKGEAETAAAEAWQERLSVFKETATDFDAVVFAPSSPFTMRSKDDTATMSLSRDVLRMEEGPQLAYHLAKHPAVARDLKNMSERDRFIELGRLAGRMTQEPVRRISQAPTPVDAVGGKGAQSGSFDPLKATEAEYIAKRKAGWRG